MTFASRQVSSREAVRDVQRLANIMSGRRVLAEDGIFGRNTDAVLGSLSTGAKALVSALDQASGGYIAKAQKAVAAASASRTEIIRMITASAIKHGVSPSLAVTIANMESTLNPNSRSKTGASGLFQLTDDAVKDVYGTSKSAGYRGPSDDRADIPWNIETGVRFIKKCAGYARRSPMSENQADWVRIYAAYNVGSGSLATLDAKRFSDPSLVRMVNLQAPILKHSGPMGYMNAVDSYISSRKITV